MRCNVFLKDLTLDLPATDDRRLGVVADGLPLFGGAQLAVDATLVSPLRANGEARPKAARENGEAASAAERRKLKRYPEFAEDNSRAKLVVFAVETGGRWSEQAWQFVRQLAKAKAREAPWKLRVSAELAWRARWTNLLAIAAQRAVAETLLDRPAAGGADGDLASLAEVLADARYAGLPGSLAEEPTTAQADAEHPGTAAAATAAGAELVVPAGLGQTSAAVTTPQAEVKAPPPP